MGDKMNREYFAPGAAAFNFNNVTGGADSASGGSGGSGMECLQLRSPPGPFHYLISEQAKSLVALQELQNEVGALLEFRDLVIETFPNLRSKMAPSTPASGTRRDWEPGVRVRRKLAGGGGEAARNKPQPSVQDSGFSTETSCGKDAHSSAASASTSRSRPLEDELWALLDVIQRKGVRLRDEAELLRGELDERHSETAEESFARALSTGCGDCTDLVRLRSERDALLAHAAQLEAAAAESPPVPTTPLGRLDNALGTPAKPPRVPTPDSKKFAAILHESNPVELQRQLLISTVQNQVFSEQLRRAAAQHGALLDRLERARDLNEDLKFRLDEKTIELEGTRARVRQLENKQRSASDDSLERSRDHSSMRDMALLLDEPRIADTPRARPSRIPLHTAHKGAAPRPPPPAAPPRPPSAHSARSVRSAASTRSRASQKTTAAAAATTRASTASARKDKSSVPVRRASPHDKRGEARLAADGGTEGPNSRGAEGPNSRGAEGPISRGGEGPHSRCASLVAEYLARTERLALHPVLHTRLAYDPPHSPSPHNLALELTKSILYENTDSIDIKTLKSLNSHEESLWNGKPQQYFESINCEDGVKEFEDDSLA